MLGVDTNVLVRLLTADDPKQAALAGSLIKKAAADEPVVVNLVVLAEMAWVLGGAYSYSQKDVRRAISALLDSSDFSVERREAVSRALADAERSEGDFADSLVAALNRALGCSTTATFDKRASGRPGGMSAVEDNL